MTIDKAKLAPFAAFLGGIGYTLYPYIDPPTMIFAATDLPEKMKDEWFQPKITNASTRNPFAPRIDPAVPPTEASPSEGRPTVAGPTRALAKKPSFVAVGSDTAGLSLGAVIIGGNRPAAVINGSVFLIGDDVPTNPPGESRWRLVSISQNSVDLVDFTSKRTVALPFKEPAALTKSKNGNTTSAKVAARSSRNSAPQDELSQLRDVLGSASDTMTPLPPGVTEALGRMIGADLKNGDLGAIESFLGAAPSIGPSNANASKSGKPQ